MEEPYQTSLFNNIPYAVNDLAVTRGFVRELGVLLTLRASAKNGVIYGSTNKDVYRCLNKHIITSLSSSSRYRRELLKLGLIKQEGPNLRLASNDDLRDFASKLSGKPTGKGLVTIKVHKNLTKTVHNLQMRPIIRLLGQQINQIGINTEADVINRKAGSSIPLSKKEYNFYKKYGSTEIKKMAEKGKDQRVFISDKLVSEKCGVSFKQASVLIAFAKSQGLLEFVTHKEEPLEKKVSLMSYEIRKDSGDPSVKDTFWNKGSIYKYHYRTMDYGASINTSEYSLYNSISPNIHTVHTGYSKSVKGEG